MYTNIYVRVLQGESFPIFHFFTKSRFSELDSALLFFANSAETRAFDGDY